MTAGRPKGTFKYSGRDEAVLEQAERYVKAKGMTWLRAVRMILRTRRYPDQPKSRADLLRYRRQQEDRLRRKRNGKGNPDGRDI
jgi:hypothetical protein